MIEPECTCPYENLCLRHGTTLLGYKNQVDCLEFKLQELQEENERLKVDPQERPMFLKELQELTALCMAQAEALKRAKIVVDYTAPEPYPNHSCGNPDAGCDGHCVDVVSHGKIQQAIDDCLSSPPSQKLLRRMEVYAKAIRGLEQIKNSLTYVEVRDLDDASIMNLQIAREEAKEILQQAKEEGLC